MSRTVSTPQRWRGCTPFLDPGVCEPPPSTPTPRLSEKRPTSHARAWLGLRGSGLFFRVLTVGSLRAQWWPITVC